MFDELKRCMRRQLEVRVQAVTSTDRFNIQFRTAGMDKTKERLGQREDGRGSASNYAADSYRKGMWNPKPRRALFLVLPEVTVIQLNYISLRAYPTNAVSPDFAGSTISLHKLMLPGYNYDIGSAWFQPKRLVAASMVGFPS